MRTVLASGVRVQSRSPPQRSVAPRAAAAARCSAPRSPTGPGPFSPPVSTSMVTGSPAAAWASSAPPQPSSMSSGCAPIARTLRMAGLPGGDRLLARAADHPAHDQDPDAGGDDQADGDAGAVALARE